VGKYTLLLSLEFMLRDRNFFPPASRWFYAWFILDLEDEGDIFV
jgi:hypothetical protein